MILRSKAMGFGASTAKTFKAKAGAIWKRVSKSKGEEFFSGQLEVNEDLLKHIEAAEPDKNGKKYIDIIIFNNPKDPGSKYPDFNIYYSEKRG